MHSKLFTPPPFKLHDIFHFHHILIVTKHYYYNTMLLLSRAGPGRKISASAGLYTVFLTRPNPSRRHDSF